MVERPPPPPRFINQVTPVMATVHVCEELPHTRVKAYIRFHSSNLIKIQNSSSTTVE
jgi:hypothetical protein